jgi:carboxyl-terminal processing protease
MSMRDRGRRWLAAVALAGTAAALSACALIDPLNMLGRESEDVTGMSSSPLPGPASAPLTPEQRTRAFDFVWNTIDTRYHDAKFNGVDWRAVGERYRPLALAAPDDDTFWDVLDRMTGELHDAHTRVESPRRVALRKSDESVTLGFFFQVVEGQLAVASVNTESDAWWAGVRPGMTITAIEGQPAWDAYRKLRAEVRHDSTDRAEHIQAVRKIMVGAAGSRVAFAFQRADGTRLDAVLARRKLASHPLETHRVLPSGYGYIRFGRWSLGLTSKALAGVDELKDTPGLIIDLRNNPGGAVHAVNMMLSRFFTTRTELGRATTRSGEPVSILMGALQIIQLQRVVEGDPNAYRGPVVILVNGQSASGSELFAGSMQAAGRAKVMGEPSCGCLLGFLGYARVPGGADLAYSEVGFVLSNGRKVEGEGVIPDVAVPPSLADLRYGRDRALEEAQALLAKLTQAPTAAPASAAR